MCVGWYWTDGSALNYEHWESGEPNSIEELCGEMYLSDGMWNDNFCTGQRGYICKRLKGNITIFSLGGMQILFRLTVLCISMIDFTAHRQKNLYSTICITQIGRYRMDEL